MALINLLLATLFIRFAGRKELSVFQRARNIGLIVLILLMGLFSIVFAVSELDSEGSPHPISIDGRTLFEIYSGTGSLSARERASLIRSRIIQAANNPAISPESIRLKPLDTSIAIMAGKQILLLITENDAEEEQELLSYLAIERLTVVQNAVSAYRKERTTEQISESSAYAALFSFILLFSISLLKRFYNAIRAQIAKRASDESSVLPQVQKFIPFPLPQYTRVALWLNKVISLLLLFSMLYIYLYGITGLFPQTRKYSKNLLKYALEPMISLFDAFVGFLPNLITIAIILAISRYLIFLSHIFFSRVKTKVIVLPGFYEDWADTTHEIIRILIIALMLVTIYPYIPGSQSAAFQGVSVFLGVLLSLGSNSLISNIVSGIVLTYTRAFQIGDRVRVSDNDIIGDIVEKTLIGIRIRTIKNVEVFVPNSKILGTAILNYSTNDFKLGLILHTTVSIGYDTPWRLVQQLLIDAAKKTPDILPEPEPFVFQKSLDDSFITYEINAYTRNSNNMAQIYSNLHKHIQDGFNDANIEILSPHYSALRDGNRTTVPTEYLPQDYAPPAFRLSHSKRSMKNPQSPE